jgi:hypothetical protein
MVTVDLDGATASTRVVVGPGREIDIRITKVRSGTQPPIVVVAPVAGGEPRVEPLVRTNDGFAMHLSGLPEEDLLVLVEPISGLS